MLVYFANPLFSPYNKKKASVEFQLISLPLYMVEQLPRV